MSGKYDRSPKSDGFKSEFDLRDGKENVGAAPQPTQWQIGRRCSSPTYPLTTVDSLSSKHFPPSSFDIIDACSAWQTFQISTATCPRCRRYGGQLRLERSNPLRKSSPGLVTGLILGVLCLTLAIGLYIWAPNFTGFFNRPGAQPAMAVWTLMLLLAIVNFAYAGISHFLQRKIDQVAKETKKPNENA